MICSMLSRFYSRLEQWSLQSSTSILMKWYRLISCWIDLFFWNDIWRLVRQSDHAINWGHDSHFISHLVFNIPFISIYISSSWICEVTKKLLLIQNMTWTSALPSLRLHALTARLWWTKSLSFEWNWGDAKSLKEKPRRILRSRQHCTHFIKINWQSDNLFGSGLISILILALQVWCLRRLFNQTSKLIIII